jgi:type I restriction enzyme, S subunit
MLRSVSRPVHVSPESTYRLVGAHWYAKGLYVKEQKSGAEIQARTLFQIKEGDFVYNRLFAWKGSFAVATQDVAGCFVSNEFPCFVPLDTVDSKFLWFYFSRSSAWSEALGLSSGSTPTSRNRLKEKQFLDIEVLLPPIDEQRRIVSRIEQLANKVESAGSLRAESDHESEAILEGAVQRALDESASLPSRKLSGVSSKIGSGSTPLGGRANYPSSGIPFIRSLNVRMRRFQWERMAFIPPATHESMSGTKVRPNDVLLNITGASIGRVACAPADLREANVNQHVAIIRPLEMLDSRYLMYWLSQPKIQEFINDQEKGATRQGFTKAQIQAFMIPLPSLEDQKNTVAYLDDLQVKIDSLKNLQSETAKELGALMPSILSKAFRGEL